MEAVLSVEEMAAGETFLLTGFSMIELNAAFYD